MFTRRQFNATALAVPASLAVIKPGFAATARDRVLGSPDAPVSMIEYSSLTCPHCANFHRTSLKDLKSRYIDNGDLNIVFRDFPTDGLALLVAQVPHCVGDHQYFPLLDQLFANQAEWRSAAKDDASVAMVNDLGLTEKLTAQGFGQGDVEAVSGILRSVMQTAALAGLSNQAAADCLGDKELRDSIWKRAEAGRNEFNIRSTPSFVVDGETHAGAMPIDEFAKIIDPLL